MMGKPIDTLSLIRSLQDKLDTQVGYKEDYRVSYMGAMDDLHTAPVRRDG